MEIYPNGYYNYRKHRKDAKLKEKEKLLKVITEIYHMRSGRMGYRSMWLYLRNEGYSISLQTVRKYMNVELCLKSVTRKKKRKNVVSQEDSFKTFDNLLMRNFHTDSINSKWCIDFTYTYFGNKKRYNCSIIDLYNRSVVASVNSSHIDTQLAIDTVEKAIKRSDGQIPDILHSDRGSQFTSKAFVDYCASAGIKQSMSKPGCPYDNAPMERYFNTLKTELLYLHEYETEAALYSAINNYAYGYYNNKRPHTYNGGLPPSKIG